VSVHRRQQALSLRSLSRKSYNYEKNDKLDELLGREEKEEKRKKKDVSAAVVGVGWVPVGGGEAGADVIECVLDHRSPTAPPPPPHHDVTISTRENDGDGVENGIENEKDVNGEIGGGGGGGGRGLHMEDITDQTEFLVKWKNWSHLHNRVPWKKTERERERRRERGDNASRNCRGRLDVDRRMVFVVF
jgi:hypothetical protein